LKDGCPLSPRPFDYRYTHHRSYFVLSVSLSSLVLVHVSPQLAVKNCFIRGSVVRYVQLPAPSVDTALLQDAARRERQQPAAGGRK